MRALPLLAAALVAACSPEQSEAPAPPAGMEGGTAAPAPAPGAGLPDPPPPPPRAKSLPGLLPLTGEQIRTGLGAGPYCTLSDGGGPLMAAKVGGAIVSDRGRIVRLTPEARDGATLREGGRFVSGAVAVEVDAGAVVARSGKMVERDAGVTVTRGRYGFSVSHGPRWSCGG